MEFDLLDGPFLAKQGEKVKVISNPGNPKLLLRPETGTLSHAFV